MLIIDNEAVAQVINMDMTITALEDAYLQHVRQEAVCRPRIDIRIPTPDPNKQYRWGTMEGGSSSGYFAIRMKSDIIYEQEYQGAVTQEKYCGHPGQYCGLILLIDVTSGEPVAFLNDGVLQQMRVGADGGIGVKYAAREDVKTIGMFGSGGQARTHMAAYMHVRPGIERLQVYSPTPENRERFGAEMAEKYGLDVQVCDKPEAVYKDADILASITDSAVPVIEGSRIEPGTHVINIGGGSSVGGGGTPADDVLGRVDVYLRFGNATAPWGLPETQDEYITYAAKSKNSSDPKLRDTGKRGHGPLLPDRMITLAEMFEQGLTTVRTSDDQITYSERGNLQGHQFWSVGGRVYEAVTAQGLGREIPTEWFLQDIRN